MSQTHTEVRHTLSYRYTASSKCQPIIKDMHYLCVCMCGCLRMHTWILHLFPECTHPGLDFVLSRSS